MHLTLDYQNGKFKVQDANGNVINETSKEYPDIPINKAKSTLELEFKAFLEAVKHHRDLVNSAESTLWISRLIDHINQKEE